ncbi:uncharacterized protein ISCGN_014275 [Ixodes scapularis]
MHSAALGPTQATSSSGPSLQCSSVAASRAVLDQAEPDRLQNSPLPCSSAVMHSAALAGPNHPAPVCRKLTKRPEDVIKRLQARISSYRKTIARLRKQQLKTPQTASQALEIIRPHVSEEMMVLSELPVLLTEPRFSSSLEFLAGGCNL